MAKNRTNYISDDGRSYADCSDGRAITSWTSLGGSYSGPTKTLDEPLQGCAKDCFFLAALKAVAFKARNRLSTSSTTFTFYYPVSGQDEIQSLNDSKIAIYNTVTNPVYARCSTVYRWPMLYEKAYALWLDSKNSTRHWDPVDPTQPDIKTIFEAGGNGVTAMMHISRYRNKVEKGAIEWDGNVPRYPTIAATKDIDPLQLGLPDQLTRKHTYAIYQKDANYYYLKDPCNNLSKRVTMANLNTSYFDTWGYVYP